MNFKLKTSEEKILLELARKTIEAWLKTKEMIELPPAEGALAEKSGAFVTLHKKGQLRGCIGHLIGTAPLIQTVQNMAIAAATEDPRFPPVEPVEMKSIDIEISVLSPMKRIKNVSEIEVGKHGILLGRGWQQGVLLPQVATEYKWNRETFLRHTCLKAGLAEDAWKDPDTTIEIFSAQVFGERQLM